MLSKLTERLRYILFYTDMVYVELLLSVCYLAWAWYLISANYDLLKAPNYKAISGLGTPATLGFVFLILGTAKIIAVITSTRWLRAVTAALGTALWTFISVGFWLSNAPPTGQVIYMAFAISCALIFIRQARLQRDGKEEKRHL